MEDTNRQSASESNHIEEDAGFAERRRSSELDCGPGPSASRRSEANGSIRRFAISVLLVITVGSAAYLLSREPAPSGRQNLIEVTVSTEEVPADLISRDRENLEQYIREEFGVKIAIPEIQDAEITGIGALAARRDISIPTILIDDPAGDVRQIFVFTYSLLDRWSSGVFLERAVRVELENDEFVVVATENEKEAVVWRSGDDIFVAVAENGAGRLVRRIGS